MSPTNGPPLSLSWMFWKRKLPGQEGKAAAAVGTATNEHDLHEQEVPKLKECALGVSSCPRGILKARGKDPHLPPAGPELLQGWWHYPTFWSLKGPRGVQAFWQGPQQKRSQPHQTLCKLQGLEVQAMATKTNPRAYLVVNKFLLWLV